MTTGDPDASAYSKRLAVREWAPLPQRVVPELLLEMDLLKLRRLLVGRLKIDPRHGGPSDDDWLVQATLVRIIDLIEERRTRHR